jgi:ankyrin repeat protein
MSPAASSSAALKAAICANDAAAVADVLQQHPDLKSQLDRALPDFDFGATPLLGAVYRNNRDMVDVLLGAGADINARSDWWAGSFGVLDHEEPLADYLIGRGARIDAHAAARLGMLDRLEALVSADPQLVHARGGDGKTPLHLARSVPIAEFLLARGADIDARDVDHESTPAQYLVRDRQDVARFLVDRGCRTDILMAAALGNEQLVRKHLDTDPSAIRVHVSEEHFPKQNLRSGGSIYIWTLGAGKYAHVIAREFGHEAIFRLLMEASPDALKLAAACEIGDDALIKKLTRDNPHVASTLTPFERRRLPEAARDNNLTAVRRMLEAGWTLDAVGQHGATALHWAGWHGNVEMIRELLRHDPPLDVKDRDFGGTPLSWTMYAREHGWSSSKGDYAGSADLLIAAGARPPQ